MSDSAVAGQHRNGHDPGTRTAEVGTPQGTTKGTSSEPQSKSPRRPERSMVQMRQDLAGEVFDFVLERYGRFYIDRVMALTFLLDYALKIHGESGRKIHELVSDWDAEADREATSASFEIDARTKDGVKKVAKSDFFNLKGFNTITVNLLVRLGLEHARQLPPLDDPFGQPLLHPEDLELFRDGGKG